MAAEIRVDTIKSRSGINTIFFGGDSISFNPHVGIGTTVNANPVTSGNTGKLSVGIISARDQYVGLITANRGAGLTYVNVGTGLSVTGITTFACASHMRIPVGATGSRPGSPLAGDFRYNSTTGEFEGYTDEWGSIGGGTKQVSGIVSTTSTVGFAASFAIADYRSASVNFLINDATGASQAGKYIMIHDGTTVTVVEQVAVATGSMLGTLSGAIVGTNAELQVTMVSSGVATCSAKLNTMSDSA
tara:strand:+ start:196 stop:930 length:735 start_codon:yes stop_codon:yes gene_type:complete